MNLTKMGPTSTNCCPARFKFIKSDEQKQLFKESLLPNNIDKVMSAPVIAIIGFDLDFSDNMGKCCFLIWMLRLCIRVMQN